MKVLLINPPFENTLKIGIDSELMDLIGNFPPMGLLFLATSLKQNGIITKIIDCPSEKISHKKLIEVIKEYSPEIIGITTFTTTMVDVLLCANYIKNYRKEIVVVLGGHHVYSYPEHSANYPNVDYILRGESDYTFTRLVLALTNKSDLRLLKEIPGIGFKTDEGIYLSLTTDFVSNLDELPIPDRCLLPNVNYYNVFDLKEKETIIISSRGCPFNCSFCFSPEKNYRSRSIVNIILEIKKLYKQGCTNFFFFDDLFSLKADKVIQLSNAIISENLKITWGYRGRINTINDEMLALAKRSGLKRIQFGIESFNQEVLDKCFKNIRVENIFTTLKLCKKHKILTVGNLIIGLPGQTEKIILSDIEASKKCGLDFVEYNLFTPMPHTNAYDKAIREGSIPFDFWHTFSIDPLGEFEKFKMYYYEKDTPVELQFKLCNYAFRSFYLRPKFVFRRMKSIKSFSELWTHIKGALKLLKFNPNNY